MGLDPDTTDEQIRAQWRCERAHLQRLEVALHLAPIQQTLVTNLITEMDKDLSTSGMPVRLVALQFVRASLVGLIRQIYDRPPHAN